jgi:hypothetical protein
MKIYKYPLSLGQQYNICTLKLPAGYKILTIQAQHDIPVLWALVDETQRKLSVQIAVIGTGYDFTFNEENANYISTVQLNDGNLILHFFEI